MNNLTLHNLSPAHGAVLGVTALFFFLLLTHVINIKIG